MSAVSKKLDELVQAGLRCNSFDQYTDWWQRTSIYLKQARIVESTAQFKMAAGFVKRANWARGRSRMVGMLEAIQARFAEVDDSELGSAAPSALSLPVRDLNQTINIHGDVTGSTIQQGNHNTAAVTYQSDVRQVVEEIRSVMNASKLTADAKDELRAEVETVEAQVKSPRPKHPIIREGLASARHILEHAFGAGMAHYFPLLLKFLEHHQ